MLSSGSCSIMASSLALKKILSSAILPNSTRSIRPLALSAPSSYRLFNNNALRDYGEDGDHDCSLEDDRRYRRPLSRPRDDFSSDVFDPFSATRSLSQVLNMMDQLMDNPVLSSSRAGMRRGWDVRETEEGLNLRVDMPGLGKEDVKVWVEQNTLVIKGEEANEGEDGESGRRYSSRIDLPERVYKTDEIKAEMKNGVLKVVVPRVKENERSDVFEVKIE